MNHTLKKKLLGTKEKNGILKLTLYYAVLIAMGFVFIYPILYMAVNSFFSPEDINDPAVFWIPTEFYFGNFEKAFNTLDFFQSFSNSIIMALGPSILQTVVAAVTGFALARFNLPLKKVWIVLILSTFLIPMQITNIPKYILFNDLKLLNSVAPFYLTSLLGQGIRSAIFILIFHQFFSNYPKSFDEAAELDGAGKIRIFFKIAIPISTSAIVLTLLFSFVWYWNETTQANLFFGSEIKTLPLQLANFMARYEKLYSAAGNSINKLNESVTLAGTMLSILPTVILYICAQKQFVESVENSGITGE